MDVRLPISPNLPSKPPSDHQTCIIPLFKILSDYNLSSSAITSSSGCATSTWTRFSMKTGSSAEPASPINARLSINAMSNHAHNQCQFINSLALAILIVQRQILLPGTLSIPGISGADVSKFIKEYDSLSSHTWTDPVSELINATFLYYCSETIQVMIHLINQYFNLDRKLLKEELKDAFHHTNSQIYLYTVFYLQRICKQQL